MTPRNSVTVTSSADDSQQVHACEDLKGSQISSERQRTMTSASSNTERSRTDGKAYLHAILCAGCSIVNVSNEAEHQLPGMATQAASHGIGWRRHLCRQLVPAQSSPRMRSCPTLQIAYRLHTETHLSLRADQSSNDSSAAATTCPP